MALSNLAKIQLSCILITKIPFSLVLPSVFSVCVENGAIKIILLFHQFENFGHSLLLSTTFLVFTPSNTSYLSFLSSPFPPCQGVLISYDNVVSSSFYQSLFLTC